MSLNYDKVINYKFEPLEQTYTARDTMLYALGLGLSHDPTNRDELRFTFENELQTLPTMSVVLCRPGTWYQEPELGIDWVRMLHGEQSVYVIKPLPIAATVIGYNRVTKIIDKGKDKGAILYIERDIVDKHSGDRLATLNQTLVMRGNGGFGGPSDAPPRPHAVPDRPADLVTEAMIDPRAALIYRLSGDYNEIHADPALAVKAGFSKPIFQGLGSFGMLGVEVLKHLGGYDPARLISISARFTAPVYPGETLRAELWKDGANVYFRGSIPTRSVVVVDNGCAHLSIEGT
jgi:acyl dehydratase